MTLLESQLEKHWNQTQLLSDLIYIITQLTNQELKNSSPA